ncbi:tyrosine-protein phosphatase 99A isoform X2 [Cylas formicarius]|uniref:tyrosine-protein phosphatase 99A isoform X2 n=1 Tax=Cylas formicarius TaxID=197179 RepID=UPI00295848D8|nr:tyrosine-protein phosphatase 99A isoform X2 [Cylas formicarius]XP_060536954.1 tyrosine-protein phosphatase 99A isoform X2 [Cylas formicarius]
MMGVICLHLAIALVGLMWTFAQDDTHPRFYDIPSKTEHYKTYAKQNISFRCPGANENTLVEQLEWYSHSKHKKVLEYRKNAGITVYTDWLHRVTLDKDYGLIFNPAKSTDTGDYVCLINHRILPDVLIRFSVIDVPDPPGRPLITFFSSRAANLSWAPPKYTNYSNITHYTVMIRKHMERPDPEEENVVGSKNFTVQKVNTTSNDPSFYVKGLRPYTVYSFQIIAWNALGSSNPSKPSFFMVTLRELPEARIPFTARNMSSTQVFISWEPPDIDLINGDFLGYRLTWTQLKKPRLTQEKYIRNASITKHVISELLPFTKYHVGLSVFNPEGYGPNTTLLIITDEGQPSPPRNLTVRDATDTSLLLQWYMPERTNGILVGYRIYYTYGNYTDTRTDKSDPHNPIKTYLLTDLKPDTAYSIKVKAFSSRHEGLLSNTTEGRTDILGPSPPKIVNASCEYNSSLRVEFEKPDRHPGSIDLYYIDVYDGGIPYNEATLNASAKYLAFSFVFQNVTPDIHYDVQVSAASRSNRSGRLVRGEKSKLSRVYVTEGCYHPTTHVVELWAGILAGLLCASGVLLLAGGGYLVWKKFIQAPYYYLDNTQCTPAPLDWNTSPDENEVEDYSGPIAVAHFAEHVQKLHADGDIGFSKEYEAIQNDPSNEVNSSENSQHPDNKPKNRYLNIIAYDHSRVQLLPMPSQKVSTYINANYIDGFSVNRAYIGTQGPLPSTFDCFWRMIWEQRVTIIVMITNLVERGRRKCDMYWPKEGIEDYGVIQVRLVKEDVMATYTIRTLVIRHTRVKNKKDSSLAEKTVYQYHYTNWPDHGTPDHPLPVISFVKKSSSANPSDSGPIVVHCSAGVGRTGTYIVLDAMLKQIKTRGEVNIFGFLKHIRAQRNFLVQTEEQYIFIHDALVEAIECGETDIMCDSFTRYLEVLQNPESIKGKDESVWKPLGEQFKQVTSFVPRDFNLVSANKPVNQRKNRCSHLIPIESARVHLTPKPGEDGSDYINASWLPGFHSLREFVITQHPVSKEDFWKMCWDHAAQLIVMLSITDTSEFEVFWPDADEIIETDIYTCQQVGVNMTAPYITRDFMLKSVQDDYEFKVKFVQCHNWPHQGVGSIKGMYDLPNYCISLQKVGQGPICVVDRYGGTEAATLCALITLKKHLAYEQKVDVYMYAKLYHNKRPGIWPSADDFLKLYLCVQTICGTPEKYLEEIPPDMFTIANGVKGRSAKSSENQPSCSRSPDGLPASNSTETSCPNLQSSPDLKEVIIEPQPSANDFVRVPPEGLKIATSNTEML